MRNNSKPTARNFDSVKVASLETEMWRAYYAHNFLKLLRLIFVLIRTQFGLSWLNSIRASSHAARAAMLFRRKEDLEGAECYLIKYFTICEQDSDLNYDPVKAAQLELHWWLIHRRPKKYEQTLADALAEVTAHIYSMDKSKFTVYGEQRYLAMHERDVATFKDKREPGWDLIQSHLTKSYVSLLDTVS